MILFIVYIITCVEQNYPDRNVGRAEKILQAKTAIALYRAMALLIWAQKWGPPPCPFIGLAFGVTIRMNIAIGVEL